MLTREVHPARIVSIAAFVTDCNADLIFSSNCIKAGFPSPADDFIENRFDFNRDMIRDPDSTFYCRVDGDSMRDAGIGHNDILVVDRSLIPRSGDVAICSVDNEFTVKRINIEKDVVWLLPENEDFKPIRVTSENELVFWGVVIYTIKSFR